MSVTVEDTRSPVRNGMSLGSIWLWAVVTDCNSVDKSNPYPVIHHGTPDTWQYDVTISLQDNNGI
jgi:hypothetical protein